MTDPMNPTDDATPHEPHRRGGTFGRADEPPSLRIAEIPAPGQTTSDAFYGAAGDYVRAVLPFTEADPWGLLVSYLAAFGSVIGSGPHITISSTRHTPRVWPVLVGETSEGRKGTALDPVRPVFSQVDDMWAARWQSNAASGEALIHEVRDQVTGVNKDGDPVVTDPGVDDKRLFVVESEFASPLRVAGRAGSILSPVIRQAWDSGRLSQMAKHNPARATDAHIVIVGHVTPRELREETTTVDVANGFLNRFLFFEVRRSKNLPRAPRIPSDVIDRLADVVGAAVVDARGIGEMEHAETFWAVFEPRYDSPGLPSGMAGTVCGRWAPQVHRLAMLYALLDGTRVMDGRHAAAALAVWDRAAASARSVFGTYEPPTNADRLLEVMTDYPDGMTRTQIRDLFNRHVTLDPLLQPLIDSGRIIESSAPGDGRPARVYTLATEATEATEGVS